METSLSGRNQVAMPGERPGERGEASMAHLRTLPCSQPHPRGPQGVLVDVRSHMAGRDHCRSP